MTKHTVSHKNFFSEQTVYVVAKEDIVNLSSLVLYGGGGSMGVPLQL